MQDTVFICIIIIILIVLHVCTAWVSWVEEITGFIHPVNQRRALDIQAGRGKGEGVCPINSSQHPIVVSILASVMCVCVCVYMCVCVGVGWGKVWVAGGDTN